MPFQSTLKVLTHFITDRLFWTQSFPSDEIYTSGTGGQNAQLLYKQDLNIQYTDGPQHALQVYRNQLWFIQREDDGSNFRRLYHVDIDGGMPQTTAIKDSTQFVNVFYLHEYEEGEASLPEDEEETFPPENPSRFICV